MGVAERSTGQYIRDVCKCEALRRLLLECMGGDEIAYVSVETVREAIWINCVGWKESSTDRRCLGSICFDMVRLVGN